MRQATVLVLACCSAVPTRPTPDAIATLEARVEALEASLDAQECPMHAPPAKQRDVFEESIRCSTTRRGNRSGVVLPETLFGTDLGRAPKHRGPDGKADGYRLSGLRRGSRAHRLGLRSGDILYSVNGFPVRHIDEADAAAWAVREADTLYFRLTRRGEPIELIVDGL